MSASRVVAILDTGVANIASVRAALKRAGKESRFVSTADEVQQARALVFPGVGAFGAGMRGLHEAGVVEALRKRLEEDLPTLAICLGLQLLFAESEESKGVAGLGFVPGRVQRFQGPVRVPQFGWNRVEAAPESRFLTDGYAYFANSYAVMDPPEGWRCSLSTHGQPFVAAMEKGNWLACQFHPEISGPWGQQVISKWLEAERS